MKMGTLHRRAGSRSGHLRRCLGQASWRGAPAAIAANPVVIASSSTGPYTRPARPRRGCATDVVGNHFHPGDSVGSCGKLRQQHPLHLHIQATDGTNWYEATGPPSLSIIPTPLRCAPGI